MRKFGVVTCAVLICTAFAQEAKQNPPPPGPPRPFNFPKYETKKLDNGLTVFVIEDHREPLVSYLLNVATAGGSANEPSEAGLALLTASLLREGTKTRKAQQIAKTIDTSGGNLDTTAGSDTASAACTMMKSKADLGLDLLADIIINPSFPEEEVGRQMQQTLSNLKVSFSDPSTLASYLARRTVFGTHPYAMPVSGTPATVAKIKREDIVSFYQTHYAPAYTYLAISGDVVPAEAFAKAQKYFGSWKATAEAPASVTPHATDVRHIVLVNKPDAVQTQYSIVQVAIARNDPDYIPLLVANQIFGGGYNSRLNTKLRLNEGLTYGASSALEPQKQGGVFIARSFSRTEKASTAIKMMADLLAEYREHPVSDTELNEAKAYLAGSFAINVETPEAVAQRVLVAAIDGLPANYWDTYRDKILATTAEQVTAAVRRHLTPDKMDVVAVGNTTQLAKDLQAMGTVEVIPLSEFDILSPNMRTH